MRLKRPIVFHLLLVLLAGNLLSACSSVAPSPTAPAPTADLQPAVDALVSQSLEKMQQEAAAIAESQRLIAEILTPAPTTPPASTTTPGPGQAPLPIPAMGLETGGFVDPGGRFRFSWWPEGWSEDTRFGKELLSDNSPLFVSNIIFFGGSPITGGYNPNLMVMRLPVPMETELHTLVDQELNQLKLAYPGIRVVDRQTTSQDGIPAELVATVHDDNSLQFFYLILLQDNREWFVQCTLFMGVRGQAQVCREVLDGFGFTDSPVLR